MPKQAATTDDLVRARRLWPLAEAAQLLGTTTRTLYRLRERGELAIVRIGRRSYVTDAELQRYVAALEAAAS